MARSLRSKRRRKLHAIKRKRYGKKELIRLKKMLGLPTGEEVTPGDTEVKVETDNPEITGVVSSDEVQQIEPPENDRDWEELEDVSEVVNREKRTHKIRKSHRPNARHDKPRSSRHKGKKEEASASVGEEEQMDHDQRRRYNKHTQRDQFGNYPVWMNQKTVKQLAKKSKKIKRLQKKKQYKHICKTGTRKYSKAGMATETVGLNEAIIGFKKIAVEESTSSKV